MRAVTLLGATGSIGQNTLDVIARHPDRFSVFALTGHRQLDQLFADCVRFRPQLVVVPDGEIAEAFQLRLQQAGLATVVLHGEAGLIAAATAPEVDSVMAAIVGAAGLPPALAAAKAGKRVLLANKEALVVAGQLFIDAVAAAGGMLLPIDSEHNAIFQTLPTDYRQTLAGGVSAEGAAFGIRRLLLTASGGPFREATPEQLARVTPDQACAHPNWVMGRKISVDSASMMNKGLEVIEAHWLFGLPAEQIEVVIHTQSVIHSMVEYVDGSILAQMGSPDMRTPIAYALDYPERIAAGVSPLDLIKTGTLTFSAPDLSRFPCLGLAYAALKQGGTAPAVLNAANEIAVDAFLHRGLAFNAIPHIVDATLNAYQPSWPGELVGLMEIDRHARDVAHQMIDVA